jgi:hypothetical protein
MTRAGAHTIGSGSTSTRGRLDLAIIEADDEGDIE